MVTSIVLRLLSAVQPLLLLYVGKLIIDEVVRQTGMAAPGPTFSDWLASDRLVPVGSVNPLHEMNVRDEIRRVLDLGIGLIKIHPPHQLFSPNAYRAELWQLAEIYRECEARAVPVMFHTGTSVFPRARNVFADPMPIDDVAIDFPNLKIIVSHGGGSIPYQIGRWRSNFGRHKGIDFDEELRKFYFDTVLYNTESLDFLFRMVGTDRCLFGTENPGTGTWRYPKTGRLLDDVKPLIDEIGWLTEQDKKNIFEDNARRVFSRFQG